MDLCPILKPRLLKPSDYQRAEKPKDAGATVEVSQKLKAADEAVVSEGEDVVREDAEAVVALQWPVLQWVGLTILQMTLSTKQDATYRR